MSETMKACPHCGSDDLDNTYDGEGRSFVMCVVCEAQGPVIEGIDCEAKEREAAAAWNDRTPGPKTAKMLAWAKGELDNWTNRQAVRTDNATVYLDDLLAFIAEHEPPLA